MHNHAHTDTNTLLSTIKCPQNMIDQLLWREQTVFDNHDIHDSSETTQIVHHCIRYFIFMEYTFFHTFSNHETNLLVLFFLTTHNSYYTGKTHSQNNTLCLNRGHQTNSKAGQIKQSVNSLESPFDNNDRGLRAEIKDHFRQWNSTCGGEPLNTKNYGGCVLQCNHKVMLQDKNSPPNDTSFPFQLQRLLQ